VKNLKMSTKTKISTIPQRSHIRKMIEASERMIREQNNPAINSHFELIIKTLQNAPRDEEKLERLLKLKRRQKDEAMHIEDTQRLVRD
jgi:hypothetical protein